MTDRRNELLNQLEDSLGDVIGIIKVLMEEGHLDAEAIEVAAHAKANKIQKKQRVRK